MNRAGKYVALCLLLLGSTTLYAQPPAGYYDAAAGLTGDALRQALHQIIRGHTIHTYDEAREFVQMLDEDPADSDNVRLLYSLVSVAKSTWGDYNREHVWPQSLGASRRPARSDMHHIFAADMNVNSSRGNKYFDNTDPDDVRTHAEAPDASYDGDSWEPPDAVKGDVARALFYMDVRYGGGDDEPDLVLRDSDFTTGCDCMGKLSTLLVWNELDPVDDRERTRNDRIFDDIQGNRNPFVDHPEWVQAIWGAATELPNNLTIASFNIQFLGSSRSRDNVALASILEGYDIVVVQELVAPPDTGHFPDGSAFRPVERVAEFFNAMHERGFAYVLSEEDTGPGDRLHLNSNHTEWWVTFYDSTRVHPASDLPHGFLDTEHAGNPDFDRVPYAFAFRTTGDGLDFVLISVHLNPDDNTAGADRRAHELSTIQSWIEEQTSPERDYIILGDMNIQDRAELQTAVPAGLVSLNDACAPTNTNVNGLRPYDHVLVDTVFTTEVDTAFGFVVVDLVEEMRPFWIGPGVYPGDPYVHNTFRARYSDHCPVAFRLTVPAHDDD